MTQRGCYFCGSLRNLAKCPPKVLCFVLRKLDIFPPAPSSLNGFRVTVAALSPARWAGMRPWVMGQRSRDLLLLWGHLQDPVLHGQSQWWAGDPGHGADTGSSCFTDLGAVWPGIVPTEIPIFKM